MNTNHTDQGAEMNVTTIHGFYDRIDFVTDITTVGTEAGELVFEGTVVHFHQTVPVRTSQRTRFYGSQVEVAA
jgi:hypothetical protein